MFTGIVVVLIGCLFLLKNLGLFDFSLLKSFSTLWPIGLILVGIALIFKMRLLAFVIFLFTLALAFSYGFTQIYVGVGEERELIQEVEFDPDVKIDALSGATRIEGSIMYEKAD